MAQSSDFDATLLLMRDDGDSLETIEFDDDSGGETNSLINVILTSNGSYLLAVLPHSESSEKTGTYTVDAKSGFRPVAVARSTAHADSDRWVYAAASSDRTFEYDRRSLKRGSAGTYRTWMRTILDQPTTDESGDRYDSSMKEIEVNCAQRQYRSTLPIQYLDGNVVWSPQSNAFGPWNRLVPNSVMEGVQDKICMSQGRTR